MEQENLRLSRELRSANDKLSILNQNLEQKVVDKSHEIIHSINLLQISQEILEHLPIGIIGIDEQNMIVVSNKCAEEIFGQPPGTCLLGLMAGDALPEVLLQLLQKIYPGDLVQLNDEIVTLNEGVSIRVLINTMGDISQSKGVIIVLSPLKES